MPQRPNATFTPEKFEQILLEIMAGRSLKKILGPDRRDGFPSRAGFHVWLANEELDRKHNLNRRYADARSLQADNYFDEILEIADEDTETKEACMRNRLRVDTRKWVIGRMKPWMYGDLSQKESKKGEEDKQTHEIVEVVVTKKDGADGG